MNFRGLFNLKFLKRLLARIPITKRGLIEFGVATLATVCLVIFILSLPMAMKGSIEATFVASIAGILILGGMGLFLVLMDEGRIVKLTGLLPLYVALMIVFGTAHYAVFLNNPESYIFSDSTKEGRVIEGFSENYAKLKDVEISLLALSLLLRDDDLIKKVMQTAKTVGSFGSKGQLLDVGSDFNVGLTRTIIHGGQTVSVTTTFDINLNDHLIRVGSDFSELVGSRNIVNSLWDLKGSFDEFKMKLNELYEYQEKKHISEHEKLLSMVLENPEWNIIDFIYFGTVTMTTLGYGDIIPNSTTTRILVLLNSVIGVFFLGFALTLISKRN